MANNSNADSNPTTPSSSKGSLRDFVPHPYHSLNSDGEILSVNDAWIDLLGYERDEVEGRWFGEFLANDSVEEFESRFSELQSTDGVSNVEFEMQCADGDTIIVSCDGIPEYDDGDFVRGHCQFADITELKERARELRQFERLTNSMLESAVIYDDAGRFVTVNTHLANWYETTPDDLEGTDSNLIPLIQEQYDGDPYQELLDGEREELQGRVEANFPGHGHAVLEFRLTPLKVDGSIEGVVGVTRDITKRAEREREIRRAREEYQELVNGMNDTAWVIDHTGDFLAVNDAAVEKLGYTREELTAMSAYEIDASLDDGEIADLIESMPEDEVQVFETVHRAKNGEEIPVEISSTLISYRGESAILSIARDITQRKRQERDLQRQKRRYESLFNSIRDAILVADTNRRIINCNPAFTDLFGYELQEIEEKPTQYVYESGKQFEAMGEALEGHIDDPEFTQTISYEKKSGQTFPGETNASYFRDADGEIIGFIGIIRDITGRIERLRQLQMVDRILQHNFNNDMNVIEGYAENIEDVTTGEIATYAEKILESSQKLLQTVEKEHDVTEFLASQQETTTLVIGSEVKTLVSDMRERYPDAEISTKIRSEAAARAVPEITLAIKELLQNAIIHAKSDTPQIRVQVDADDEALKISVSDTNPHIPEMERKVLLEGEEVAPLYHGSGIGLWLVNLVVTHSDGIVEVEATEPQGNEVIIRLPN
ncbi:PAS domain S-box protein [Halanaeroarchaeum sulfurireducens]|uniref:histidine kinase n=1 Tax=Halanaeroarchaeum sulfurireducens TaxID=1604004 RepID=A0A0F7PAN5_9EURY|nr:PAS domain S-box protein [Halanaeroarchaeum sulfurireducens]AKH98241.1 PAS/PAC sensor signal transduction histidine kinase [Halanaeroarchaeum sulfurireducens]ALG82635.1 PAS/PAC sensor signal transduction histidine kinase [Halanaeroarchaeum sulfurireducens]